MNLLRPRSLSALVLLGYAMIALPLIAALVTAGVQMRRLTDSSERIVADGMAAARLTQDLVAGGALLVRQVEAFQITGTATYLEAYAAHDARLAEIERGLAERLDSTQSLQQFSTLRAAAGAQMRGARQQPPDFERLLADIARMQQLAQAISRDASSQIITETGALRATYERTKQLMVWGLALLIPLAAGAILLFSLRVGRPLRQIDRAISELGSGALHRPIGVSGPADIERLGRQLEWLRVRLHELAQERSRFLRHMSHELKTPLANLREGTELLLEGAVGPLNHEQREVGGILRENSLRLQRLIENLLSYSEWQAKRGGLDVAELSLPAMVQGAIETYQLPINAHRLTLVREVDDLSIHADRAKLRLILDNLVSNAVKFTPDGGTITVRGRRDGDDVVIEVADTGPGVPHAERERIFEAFYQGATPQGGLVRGTGIGLSVVQEFVQAHGGTIELVDGEFAGAHFRVRLPQPPDRHQ